MPLLEATTWPGWIRGKKGPSVLSCRWICWNSCPRRLAGQKDEVVVGIGVVGTPQPQAELLLAGTVFGKRDRDRASGEVDLDPDLLEVGLHLLRQRAERDAVQREVAGKSEVDRRVGDAGGGELCLRLGDVSLHRVALLQGVEEHPPKYTLRLYRARAGE